jgi:hypothetical protein
MFFLRVGLCCFSNPFLAEVKGISEMIFGFCLMVVVIQYKDVGLGKGIR